MLHTAWCPSQDNPTFIQPTKDLESGFTIVLAVVFELEMRSLKDFGAVTKVQSALLHGFDPFGFVKFDFNLLQRNLPTHQLDQINSFHRHALDLLPAQALPVAFM